MVALERISHKWAGLTKDLLQDSDLVSIEPDLSHSTCGICDRGSVETFDGGGEEKKYIVNAANRCCEHFAATVHIQKAIIPLYNNLVLVNEMIHNDEYDCSIQSMI